MIQNVPSHYDNFEFDTYSKQNIPVIGSFQKLLNTYLPSCVYAQRQLRIMHAIKASQQCTICNR